MGGEARKTRVRPASLVLLTVIFLATAMLGARLTVAHADSASFPCDSSKTVLLIQDTPPRFPSANHNPNGADVNELMAQNLPFCMIGSGDIATTELTHFSEIIIASTQNQAFYDNLFPGGTISQSISDWVQHGGVLSANLADCASGGSWSFNSCSSNPLTSYTFVGGVQHAVSFSNVNSISDASHPIITGQFGGGNGGQIVDNGCLNDLDCWQFSSHGFFVNLPTGTTIILADENGPVLIEYHFGDGLVVATTTSIEWRYDYFQLTFQNLKLLANEIGYQDFKTKCQEDDGEGEFDGSHGHGHFKHDHDKCEDGGADQVSSTDRGDGKDFQSTWIESTQLDRITRTVTIIGLGTTGGLPVSFTYVATEPTATAPGLVSFAFSDGFTNAGPVTSGSILLHGW